MSFSTTVQGASQADAVAKLTTALAAVIDPANAAEVAADTLAFVADPDGGNQIEVSITISTAISEDGKVLCNGSAVNIDQVPIAS